MELNIDKKPDESVNLELLLDIMKHIFTAILPQYGYAVRENQIELAKHILDVTARRGTTLAESETGTGKTHAYLIAAILAKRGRLNDFWLRGHYPRQSWVESAYMPVIISTSSIALQNAIKKDYIPQLSRVLLNRRIIQSPLTAVIRKGREHYVCEERLQRRFQNADEQTRALLAPFLGESAPFDLTEADSLSPFLKRSINVSGKCGENCPRKSTCRYNAYLKAINNPKVDFQITNHNYFLADTIHRASGKRPLLPDYQLVIIDEAHKFLAAARSMYGLELTEKEIPELAREIHTFINNKSNGGVNVHKLAKKLEEQSGKLFQALGTNISDDDEAERFPAVMDVDSARYLKNITGISADLISAVEDSRVQGYYRERQGKALCKLGVLNEKVSELRKQSKLIHWFENREGETSALCAIPKDLNERLYKDLWSKGIPIILTSRTLSTSQNFDRIKETLGLDRLSDYKLSSITTPSPFDYRNNALMYISECMPFPDNRDKRYIIAVADEVERLVRASYGHAAVLFTSYNVMGQVYAILKERKIPFLLFRLERGGIQAIEQFKMSCKGVLLAAGALWEGIDIPGDTLSLLIIVKLPFAVPDPIGDYERSLCGNMEIYKTRAIVPDMLVKLKQGFGRLIRTEKDTGVVALLDSRVNKSGAYRSGVLSALPRCWVTSDVTEVSKFINDKKPRGYFM